MIYLFAEKGTWESLKETTHKQKQEGHPAKGTNSTCIHAEGRGRLGPVSTPVLPAQSRENETGENMFLHLKRLADHISNTDLYLTL